MDTDIKIQPYKDIAKQHSNHVHSDKKDFKCEKCEYTTSLEGNLKQHIKSIQNHKKDFKCEKCEYSTSSERNLQISRV